MKINRLNSYSTAFTYDDLESYLTSAFLIEKEKFYLIDTFCGPESMLPILEEIEKASPKKEVVVINTHFHWDHVWGNCSFSSYGIIAHEKCRKLLHESWEAQLSKNEKYIMGPVEKKLPNITFEEKMVFHTDGIELFHSPGHTEDSISIFDHENQFLYVGDNLEKPIIYVENKDISTYIETLKKYLEYKPKRIIASHTLDITEQDLYKTINYLEKLLNGQEVLFKTEYENKIHEQNLKTISLKEWF